jgi:signal transduction histidine kinase
MKPSLLLLWSLFFASVQLQAQRAGIFFAFVILSSFVNLQAQHVTNGADHLERLQPQGSHLDKITLLADAMRVLQASDPLALATRTESLSTVPSEGKGESIRTHFQSGFVFVNGVFGLLFFLLFIFYPRQKLHLFFSLHNIFLVFMILNTLNVPDENHGFTDRHHLTSILNDFLSRLIGMSILLFMLHALNQMKPFFWWLVAFVLFVEFPLSIVLPAPYLFFVPLVRAAFTLICLWLLVAAFRTNRKEDWLIGLVASAVVLINSSNVLYELTGIDITAYANMLGPLIVTLSILIYLSLRYAHANTALEQQIVEVKNLSEENLRQEQEKQHILSAQNETLERQVNTRTAELLAQKDELQTLLEHLNATQAQLVQKEKMASLGELTAGIAHEIQNPLNFVNNFSEVCQELTGELREELQAGHIQEATSMTEYLEQNLQKIHHHGRRAAAIVKSMLQHSHGSTGEKQLINLNALAEEYLRLAYHSIHAKDKNFTCTLDTCYDQSLEKAEVVPQELGRVLLNLFNNAFYAVQQKQKLGLAGYEPKVVVSTATRNGKVEIRVWDDGTGISESVKGKIFQPFFTTKPTGQGTGLGLSLSYDIITKGHGGELAVATEQGEWTEFTITLPCAPVAKEPTLHTAPH